MTEKPLSLFDISGNIICWSPSVYACRTERMHQKVFTTDGEEVVANLVVPPDNDAPMNQVR